MRIYVSKNTLSLIQKVSWFLIGIGILLSIFGSAVGMHQHLWRSHLIQVITLNHYQEQKAQQARIAAQQAAEEAIRQAQIAQKERKIAIVADFIERYNTPLEPAELYATHFVEVAAKYQLDFRLLPSIAMLESGLCKIIPIDSYNCFGFGVYGGKVIRFESYEAGFDRVARSLRENYVDQGLLYPYQIETKYAPSSNGHWSGSVGHFMKEMGATEVDLYGVSEVQDPQPTKVSTDSAEAT